MSLAFTFSVIGQQPTVNSVSFGSGAMVSRSPDSRGWTDPALSHNKLLIADGTYQQVGTYKVKGSQFLFGQKHKADVFSVAEKAWNIFISYNTYNQELEFYSTSNRDKPLVKEPGTLDSFIIHADVEAGIVSPMKFLYGSLLGAKEKAYFQELYSGSRFSLYKRYKSELGYISTNYAEADLRQFDLEYEYFYRDNQGKGLKKIKPNASGVIKEFKDTKDLSGAVNNYDFNANQEEALRTAIIFLNK